VPLFTYKAKDDKGKIVEETIQATNRQEAASVLKAEELQVLTIKRVESKTESLFGGRISVAEKAALCRFLGTMLRAGMSLPEAVDIIRQETVNKRLREILTDVAFQIRKGSSLSAVFSQYTKDFDPVFLTMIKAGEESGTLDKSFDYLAQQLLASHEMMQKVKGALMYPAVIVLAMLANGVLMITFVLPKIADVFTKIDIEIPTATRIMLSFSNFIGENTILVLGVFFFLIIFAFLLLYIQRTRKALLSVLVKFPLVKRLASQMDISRFARTLATLLRSGVPIMESLDVAADTLSQPRLNKEAKQFSVEVAKGEPLSEVLVKSRQSFPAVMVQTVKAGEKSGSLEDVLQEMAEFYEKEVDYSLKRLTALLEPVLMLVIGVAVGAMVLMMVTPIYSIVGGMEGL
jgi:type IV pilus assembly protein PilC